MLSGPVYITPTELLTRAPLGSIPRSDVPGPFKGTIGPVARVATGTGSITLGGFVIDAYPLVLRVVTPGGIDVMEMATSLDGGVTFADPVLSQGNQLANSRWDYAIGISGIVLSATAGNYLAGDTWTASTTASRKLMQVCGALSDLFRKWAMDTGQVITDIDEADRTLLCQLGRVWLTSDRGDIPEHWMKLAETAEKYFRLEALGDIKLNSTPNVDAFVFPMVMVPRRPRLPHWRH